MKGYQLGSVSNKEGEHLTKTFINAKRVDSAKFGNEMHFMSFAAIIATKNGTEGSNFYV